MARVMSLDVVRALCILEIVAFWHLMDYLPVENRLTGKGLHFAAQLTVSILSCFTFLSGYFLGKYVIKKWADIWNFYIKRLKRFYVLFFISSFSLYLGGWFVSGNQFLFTITGLSSYIGPNPSTLWYFSMIMSFYIFTPVIILFSDYRMKLLLSLIILTIFIMINYYVIIIDQRIFIYFPFYVLGLLLPNKLLPFIKKHYQLVGGVSLFAIVLFANFNDDYTYKFASYIFSLLGIIILVSFGEMIVENSVHNFLILLSYASMAAYLFHRHIYQVFKILYGGWLSIWFAVMIVIPLIFVISYYIQKFYDSILNKYAMPKTEEVLRS